MRTSNIPFNGFSPPKVFDQPTSETKLTQTQVSRRLRISEGEIDDMMMYEEFPYYFIGDDGPYFRWQEIVTWLETEILFRKGEWNDTHTARDHEILGMTSGASRGVAI